jgi:hypothetical protein
VLAVLLATATESGSHALAAVDARKTSGFVGKSIVETGRAFLVLTVCRGGTRGRFS